MNRKLFSGLAILFSLAGFACAADHTTDSIETVKKNIADGKAVLIDVREEGEWSDGHLKDAKHLALSSLKKGLPEEAVAKTAPAGSVVYLHCASGRRCLAAAEYLKKQGYDVRPLKQGYLDLVNLGFTAAK